MVVIPYELAKQILDPVEGDSLFDLKEGADGETRDRINRALNRQDGEKEEENEKSSKKRKLLIDEPVTPSTIATQTPTTPKVHRRPPPREPSNRLTRDQLRMKLQKTGAFDTRDKTVNAWDGRTVADSNIDEVLDNLYRSRSDAPNPAGTREIAARLKLMDYHDFPNKGVSRMIVGHVSPTDTPRTSRLRWKRF